MRNFKYLAFALTIGLFAISCGDDDSTAPVVNITAPSANTSYTVADTLILGATITEDTELATIVLTSDLGLNETINTFDSDTSHVINANITFDAATTAGDYSITVTATDEAGNVGTDEVQISVQ